MNCWTWWNMVMDCLWNEEGFVKIKKRNENLHVLDDTQWQERIGMERFDVIVREIAEREMRNGANKAIIWQHC